MTLDISGINQVSNVFGLYVRMTLHHEYPCKVKAALVFYDKFWLCRLLY